ncbi:MAG TPA: hypothetical protein VN939_07875 [Chthoniobacterales bacterium]|nr:hypothetical protein [Chthoniobacterales bacterium]
MFDQAVLRQAFSEWCEREIARRLEQLAPLETGEMHLGRRGADTGFEWVDETEKQIHQLRNEIISLQTVLNNVSN